jgi:serine phosphatase RsbU (regulator of sigma subunit)
MRAMRRGRTAQRGVSCGALVLAGVDAPQLLPKLQQVLVSERHDPALFTTVCAIAVRPDGGEGSEALVRLAGHPPPVLLRPELRRLEPPVGVPLGVLPDAVWDPLTVPLEIGWSVLSYTDGLIEGRGPEPGEPLWEEGLHAMLARELETDLESLPARLVGWAQDLNGGPLADDVAILILSEDGNQ